MQIGMALPQQHKSWDELIAVAQLVEAAGYDSLWAYDHLLPVGQAMHGAQFDGLTVLAATAQATRRVKLGISVVCNNFRQPALLAKMITTVDHISHGRVSLGIGAGWYEQEHRMFGWDFPPIGTRLAMLEEAVQVIKRCWTESRPQFEGRYYHLRFQEPPGLSRTGTPVAPEDAPAIGPSPLQQPRPQLSIGGAGERRTLRIVAEHADDWNVIGPPAFIRQKAEVLATHCAALGRDPATISRTGDAIAIIDDDPTRVEELLQQSAVESALPLEAQRRISVVGNGEQIITQLQEYAAAGISHMALLLSMAQYNPATIEKLARDVLEPLRKNPAPA